jgi:alkanesulfonate monooxygenase SsuD/methylene tetrahydromethanopterin reductase-like flavin-dependent oxidoreductase (luciferase family)
MAMQAISRHSRRPLKVAFHLPSADLMLDGATPRWSDVLALARRAEAIGFDGVSIGEHFLIRMGDETIGGWDSWSLLAGLAAATERIDLTLLVTATNFRNPALIAKMADTVDEMSDGRLVLGLGTGWLKDEFDAFGFPFDYRVSRFEEAIQVIHGLLRRGQVDLAGKYYQVRECELHPRGPRPEGPPILIGTLGPRMMRLTARYADAWDTNFRKMEQLPALQAALDGACTEEGRDPSTLARSASITVAATGEANRFGMGAQVSGTVEEMAAGLRAYASMGFSQVVVWLTPCTLSGIEAFAPVLELLDRGA